ncbi:pyridoxal phosphate-dependent transferase [Trichoderma velutinum]
MLQSKLSHIQHVQALSEPLPTGSAPYTRSNFFKAEQPANKPRAKSWDEYFSKVVSKLSASPLKTASRAQKHHDMVSLGTARPSPQYFPWESLDAECSNSESPGAETPLGTGLSMRSIRGESSYDLAVAMNYGYSAGSPQMLRYITEHVEMIHNPPYKDWECCLTCGTTSGLEIAMRIFCNPGDTGPKPHVLYMIPTGQNPSGATQSLKRRREIYDVAEKHDLYILEDDPYYFIHLGPSSWDNQSYDMKSSKLSDLDECLSGLATSYASMDVSGRVLRLDSTSKVLAPGLRAGWVTASSTVIEQFISLSEVGALCPSGPTQVLLHKLLNETWGHEGFIRWLMNLSAQYRRRRDVLITACNKYLPSSVCNWKVPVDGMFLWIKLDLSKLKWDFQFPNDKYPWKTYLDIEEAIFEKAMENGVLVSRGSWFLNDITEVHGVNFRMTFAAASEDALDRAVLRFRLAIGFYYKKARGLSQFDF